MQKAAIQLADPDSPDNDLISPTIYPPSPTSPDKVDDKDGEGGLDKSKLENLKTEGDKKEGEEGGSQANSK